MIDPDCAACGGLGRVKDTDCVQCYLTLDADAPHDVGDEESALLAPAPSIDLGGPIVPFNSSGRIVEIIDERGHHKGRQRGLAPPRAVEPIVMPPVPRAEFDDAVAQLARGVPLDALTAVLSHAASRGVVGISPPQVHAAVDAAKHAAANVASAAAERALASRYRKCTLPVAPHSTPPPPLSSAEAAAPPSARLASLKSRLGAASSKVATLQAAVQQLDARGRASPAAPEHEAARRAARQHRFAEPVDVNATATAVRLARKNSFAHVPSKHVKIRRVAFAPPPFLLLNLCGGGPRDGDIDSCGAADGGNVETLDRKRGVDLCHRTAQEAVEKRAPRYTGMHGQWPCFSYSPALSLPPGGDGSGLKPVGPYRSHAEQNGLSTLPPHIKRRVNESTELKSLTIRMAYLIHDAGGSVSIESSPDARSPDSPAYRTCDGYSTATQFPAWEDDEVRAYERYSGSTRVTVPGCGAGSPYYNLKTWLLNPAAYAEAEELRALTCPGVSATHRHERMTGIASDGRSHGEHAEEYTPELCIDGATCCDAEV